MKRLLLSLAAAVITTLAAVQPANALLDVRIGYGLQNVDPSDINNYAGSTAPKVDTLTGLTADAIVSLPLIPVGLGLRYELLTYDKSNTSGSITTNVDSEFSRVSLLVNKRFIDTLIYLGGVGTIGVMNDAKVTVTNNGSKFEYEANSGFTGSVGVEAGAKLLLFNVGAEVGYMYADLGDLKTSAGTVVTNNGKAVGTDLSGVYAKVLLGVGF